MRERNNFSAHNRLPAVIAALALLVVLAIVISAVFLGLKGQRSKIVNSLAPTPAPTEGRGQATPNAGTTTPTAGNSAISHYEYVFPDGGMYVYDMDNGQKLVKSVSLPTTAGGRGVVASPATHMLYISYGGDGDGNGNGSLLKYDLLTDQIIWTRSYAHGIDSMDITPDGKTIYMPDGELSSDGTWYVIDANSGNEIGTINAGRGPHDTVVGLNGSHVYLGGRNYNYLEVADTTTNSVIKSIGPLLSGVRPFTINGAETIAYISVTGFLGFQVGDISTGKVLYTVPIRGFSWDGSGPSDPSHGISLSPDEKELYVMDWPNNYVHVFDVSGVPASPPKQVADIKLTRSMNHNESPCAYDCVADGWLQHSRDGRFVYVGDCGDVIDTSTRTVVANLPALYNTRKFLEIDWQQGVPIFTTSRTGLGYIRNSANGTPPSHSVALEVSYEQTSIFPLFPSSPPRAKPRYYFYELHPGNSHTDFF